MLVTVALFLFSVIYYAGRLTARVDQLEKSHDQFQQTLEGFFRRIEHITPRRDTRQ
jgi:hypothetical protein